MKRERKKKDKMGGVGGEGVTWPPAREWGWALRRGQGRLTKERPRDTGRSEKRTGLQKSVGEGNPYVRVRR